MWIKRFKKNHYQQIILDVYAQLTARCHNINYLTNCKVTGESKDETNLHFSSWLTFICKTYTAVETLPFLKLFCRELLFFKVCIDLSFTRWNIPIPERDGRVQNRKKHESGLTLLFFCSDLFRPDRLTRFWLFTMDKFVSIKRSILCVYTINEYCGLVNVYWVLLHYA